MKNNHRLPPPAAPVRPAVQPLPTQETTRTMYAMNPKNLFAMDFALQDDRNVRRLEHMIAGMGRKMSEVQVITVDDLPQAIRKGQWIGEVRQGAYREPGDPDFVFSSFRWVSDQERKEITDSDLYKECVAAHSTYGGCRQWFTGSRILAMFGATPFYHYEQRPNWNPGHVCWSLHDLHSAWGCAHRCSYCQRGSVYVVNLNVEEFVGKVGELLDANPWQKTWRYDVEQDVFALEPEYDACRQLVEHFARLDDRYLLLFTKSANVDFLLPLAHNGHTLMLWTLSSKTASRRYEALTGTMEERIEAAARLQEAGYGIRFKLKPIVPLRNWREETTEMFEFLYSRVKPDNLSMELLFVDSVGELDETMGLDNLDPVFVEAAKAAEARSGDWDKVVEGEKPFPHEVKEDLYRYVISESRRLSPETPITLCAETQRMWESLGDLLDGKPWNYPCNCGPHCKPGQRCIEKPEGPDAARIAAAVAGQPIR